MNGPHIPSFDSSSFVLGDWAVAETVCTEEKEQIITRYFVICHSSISEWEYRMWIDPTSILNTAATQERWDRPGPCVRGGFRGTAQAKDQGQRWSAVPCRASPRVFTLGSDCLDWWFRMFPGSQGTIIHWGRGQQWIAFLPGLLILPMTPGPHLYSLSHTSHSSHPTARPAILRIWSDHCSYRPT